MLIAAAPSAHETLSRKMSVVATLFMREHSGRIATVWYFDISGCRCCAHRGLKCGRATGGRRLRHATCLSLRWFGNDEHDDHTGRRGRLASYRSSGRRALDGAHRGHAGGGALHVNLERCCNRQLCCDANRSVVITGLALPDVRATSSRLRSTF